MLLLVFIRSLWWREVIWTDPVTTLTFLSNRSLSCCKRSTVMVFKICKWFFFRVARTEKIVVPVIFPNLLLIWAVYRCYISFCFLQKNFPFFLGGGFYSQAQRYNYYSSVHNTCLNLFTRSLWFIVFLCCFTFVLNYCFQMSSTKTYNLHIIFSPQVQSSCLYWWRQRRRNRC